LLGYPNIQIRKKLALGLVFLADFFCILGWIDNHNRDSL